MLDLPIMGVNAPREHQRVITRLSGELYYLYKTGAIAFEPFSETMIDDGKTSPTPDIILLDNETDKNVVIIEITTTIGEKSDFEKVKDLVERYDVTEGFTYNYKKSTWRKYKRGTGEMKDGASFCDAIGYDLNALLKSPF